MSNRRQLQTAGPMAPTRCSPIMFSNAIEVLKPGLEEGSAAARILSLVGFKDAAVAQQRLIDICVGVESRTSIRRCLPPLFNALAEAATPDGSLVNFERFVHSVDDRNELFRHLAENPRAVEILIRLFVGSQFLTEILIRNPSYLDRLTRHKGLADFKSRQEFTSEGRVETDSFDTLPEKLNALRRYHRWELLRIGACDTFNLMDLKTITIQLSLLADSIVQNCLDLLAEELGIDPTGFVVLAFGKLGGEELNYSSDIDLVFLSRENSTDFWPLGQRLIKALSETTAEGFLYRVDMRLRPWGASGALVNTVDAHVDYLQKHGQLWERQALLKARPIAGSLEVGAEFLAATESLIFDSAAEEVRSNIVSMKSKIEAGLERTGRSWGEVKSGPGSIRDIEFVTQYLQLVHGAEHRSVRSFNTLDGLVRLADFGVIQADEYRILSSAYVFLRTVEHSLQLMHNKQTHTLPEDEREQAYLARRLDYPGPGEFIRYCKQHQSSVREIYNRHLGGVSDSDEGPQAGTGDPFNEHLQRMAASYPQIFDEHQIQRHLELLASLGAKCVVEIEPTAIGDGLWELVVVGLDAPGDLSVICGLLFVYGFDIVSGQIFTDVHVNADGHRVPSVADQAVDPANARRFVNVFIVRPPADDALEATWRDYTDDLSELLALVYAGKRNSAQGKLVKRVARTIRDVSDSESTLYPVTIEFDNEISELSTVLTIRGVDTSGFMYELCNALTMTGIDMNRVIVSSSVSTVLDTLYVTDAKGRKLTDPRELNALRAAVVLIKHFTHLLPRSPNPESALLHFRELLEQLFERPDWVDQLSTLQDSEVLTALARLLGVSDFLWQDFLRLQHENLFPVVSDIEGLKQPFSKQQLDDELNAELNSLNDFSEKKAALNAFKDRQMFRIDMRHILGLITEFGQFSRELTDVAEVVVAATLQSCITKLAGKYGSPRIENDEPCGIAVVALGKCGGRELGFASDIELMFVFGGKGQTDGAERLRNSEYLERLVDLFRQAIVARREGIFQIDLRLRPYGRAGSVAVSQQVFHDYFALNGPAWPYERQALVKLRAIAGDEKLGSAIESLRNQILYRGDGFDAAAMRGMRERQVRQLVSSGTLNAKLSPGGLVDCEYLVQGLQISKGHEHPLLRTTNTRAAMKALNACGMLSVTDFNRLESAYIFQRRLIDALRMVRGHARDLTVPEQDSEEFEFLARRLGFGSDLQKLADDIEESIEIVSDLSRLLDAPRPA